MPGVPHVVELGIIMEPYYGSVRENFQIVMFPGISSKVLIVLSKYSISKENPIPIINPRINPRMILNLCLGNSLLTGVTARSII